VLRACVRLLVVAVTVVACLGVSVSGARAARGCGTETGRGGPYHVQVKRGVVSCRTARMVLRRYATSHARCEGSSCLRVQRGWACQTAPGFAFPRLFSCSRGRRWVAAYSLAD